MTQPRSPVPSIEHICPDGQPHWGDTSLHGLSVHCSPVDVELVWLAEEVVVVDVEPVEVEFVADVEVVVVPELPC
jgi:hypothetical protein